MAEYVQMFNGNLPFKNGSYIYGKLNKELVPVYYQGKNTDTVQLDIDNVNKTISANLTGTVKNPINDDIVSTEYTWSSEKITDVLHHSYVSLIQVEQLPEPSEEYLMKMAVIPDGGIFICVYLQDIGCLDEFILDLSRLDIKDQFVWIELDNFELEKSVSRVQEQVQEIQQDVNNIQETMPSLQEDINEVYEYVSNFSGDENITVSSIQSQGLSIGLNTTLENISAIYIDNDEAEEITGLDQVTTKRYVDRKIKDEISSALGELEELLIQLNSGSGVVIEDER